MSFLFGVFRGSFEDLVLQILNLLQDLGVLLVLLRRHLTDLLADLREHLFVVISHVDSKAGNDVNDPLFVLNWVKPPIVDHKVQLRHSLLALSDLVVLAETVSHDSDQHVEQMDLQEEGQHQEKDNQVRALAVLKVVVRVKLSKRRSVNVVERVYPGSVSNVWFFSSLKCNVNLVPSDDVVSIDECNKCDNENDHKVLDVREDDEDDVNQRCYLSHKSQIVEGFEPHCD